MAFCAGAAKVETLAIMRVGAAVLVDVSCDVSDRINAVTELSAVINGLGETPLASVEPLAL